MQVCVPAVREGFKDDERFSSSIISVKVLLHQCEMNCFFGWADLLNFFGIDRMPVSAFAKLLKFRSDIE